MEVREEMRLGTLCAVKGRVVPTVNENEEVWAHCANKGGTKAGQFVSSRRLGWCPLCK